MSAPTWRLPGKTVLITGAARGIGAESARRLAARGMKVSLVGLEPDELAKVAADCGPDAVWFEADVTDRDQLQAAVDGTIERLAGIDAVIANAGIAIGAPMRLADPESFERVIEVNLLGVYRTIHAGLPQIVERRGYVLIVASTAAILHAPGMAAYSASKAGVEALGNSLRGELAGHGRRRRRRGLRAPLRLDRGAEVARAHGSDPARRADAAHRTRRARDLPRVRGGVRARHRRAGSGDRVRPSGTGGAAALPRN